MERNVIVFGATGNTGLEICKYLSLLNIPHTAFVRSGSESKIQSKASQIIIGNVLDANDVRAKLAESSFTDVIIALGSRDLKATGIRSIGTQNIVNATTQYFPDSKVHLLSALGVRDSWQQLKKVEKAMCKMLLVKTMKEHKLQEIAIIESGLKHHITRPVALKNGPSTGNIHNQTQGFLPHGDITRADVAKYMVDSLLANKQGTSSICKEG